MKRCVKLFCCLSLSVFMATAVNAQADDYFGGGTKPRDAKSRDTTKPKAGTGNDDYFGGGGTTTTRDTSRRTTGTGGTGLPVKTVTSASGNVLTDTVKPSMRQETAIKRNLMKERTPLAYEDIREDDAVYRQLVWRVIDTREKMNKVFSYPGVEDNGNQMFLAILYRAVTQDTVWAFKDDRFSDPYKFEDFKGKFSGGMDTVPEYDLDGNIIGYQARQRGFMVDSVYQYQIKEEWIFDKESSRLFTRIVGIAPMMKTYLSDGVTAVSEELFPMFWIYYPELRATLARHDVYNGKNYGGRMSWEDLFENRMFSSFIVKSTMDNPENMPLKALINDPLFRLLEGENIKEKIFNYEQNLWSY